MSAPLGFQTNVHKLADAQVGFCSMEEKRMARQADLSCVDINLKAEGAKPCSMEFLQSRKFHHGFTLIELSVTLFIVGILFFISMPKIGNFLFRTDLKETVRSLKAAVNVLRSKSISSHKPTALHLDLDRNVYWGAYAVQERKEENPGPQSMLISPRRLPSDVRFLDAANINTSKKTFGLLSSTFNSKGALEETIIHLTDKNRNVITVVVNAYTGRFSIFDEYVDVEY
ncbi:MAG: hypothetical protein CVU64_22885 [Deltaproteobacteria bacterium HGW-Deltaproteobacteria-21]|nr:MAG: hypothetical protein CVU64_22885 [Deltaproteobacteria bacterium HGW-Deltaproteobacteria-21]